MPNVPQDMEPVNEVNARRARLVLGWVTVFGGYTIYNNTIYHLSLASFQGRLIIEYQLRLG